MSLVIISFMPYVIPFIGHDFSFMFRLTLHWHHDGPDGVSNHQSHDCLLKRLLRCRSKKTSKLRVTGFCAGNSRWPVNSPHKWPVTRKVLPFDDVIIKYTCITSHKLSTQLVVQLWCGKVTKIDPCLSRFLHCHRASLSRCQCSNFNERIHQ